MNRGAPRSVGGYVLGDKLGEGGMGAVYRARHPQLPGRELALKLLGTGVEAGSPNAVRFAREMQALAAASHPNVVRIVGGSLEGETPFYVMERVDGRSLADLDDGRPIEPRRAAAIARDLASALAHLHGLGILHRDLKPSNVLLDASGRTVICDFGLAKIAGASERERLTQTGAFLGTPTYAAPEQLVGRAHEADARADIYGVGATLYFALTGRPPFAGATLVELIARAVEGKPDLPRDVVPAVPLALEAICLRAMAREPRDRYATAQELAQDLERFLAGQITAAESDPRGPRARPGRRRLAVPLVLAALLVAGGIAFAVGRRAGPAPPAAVATSADLERTLAGLEAEHAPAERREAVRRELVARALEECERGGLAVPGLRDRARLVERRGASREELLRARERLRVALEQEVQARAAKSEALAPATLVELAAVSFATQRGEHGALPVLVGEAPGFPLGLALVDAAAVSSDARMRADLAARAQELAARFLEARANASPADRAAASLAPGLALRALAALARAGAPVAPLGPGRLDPAPGIETLTREDLAAAAALPTAAGARAAWLAVDLLAVRRPADPAALEAALARARARAPESPERAPLERLLEVGSGVEGFAALLEDLRSGRPRTPAVLARFLAREGMPSALEHLELAEAVDLPTLEATVAGEPDDPQPVPEAPPLVPAVEDDLTALDPVLEQVWELWHREGEEAGKAFYLAKVEPRLAADLERTPLNPRIHSTAAHGSAGLLSCELFRVLIARSWLKTSEIARDFSRAARDAYGAIMKTSTVYPARWKLVEDLPPLEAAARYDALLAEDVGRDALVAAALRGGLPAEEVEQARRGLEGLFRLELLGEDDELALPVRARLVLETLDRFEAFARLGLVALPFRARLRALAFPGPLGRNLAALDVLRIRARARASRKPLDPYGFLLLHGAVEVCRWPASPLRDELARDLYRGAIDRAHELGIARAVLAGYGQDGLDIALEDIQTEFGMAAFARPLRDVIAPSERLAADLAITREDRERLKRPYEYRPLR